MGESRAVLVGERVLVAWPSVTVGAACGVMRAQVRLAALLRLADRAEGALAAAMREHRAGAATAVDETAARDGLSAARDRAVGVFGRVHAAARAVTEPTRSLGGIPVVSPGFVEVLAAGAPVR